MSMTQSLPQNRDLISLAASILNSSGNADNSKHLIFGFIMGLEGAYGTGGGSIHLTCMEHAGLGDAHSVAERLRSDCVMA